MYIYFWLAVAAAVIAGLHSGTPEYGTFQFRFTPFDHKLEAVATNYASEKVHGF